MDCVTKRKVIGVLLGVLFYRRDKADAWITPFRRENLWVKNDIFIPADMVGEMHEACKSSLLHALKGKRAFSEVRCSFVEAEPLKEEGGDERLDPEIFI